MVNWGLLHVFQSEQKPKAIIYEPEHSNVSSDFAEPFSHESHEKMAKEHTGSIIVLNAFVSSLPILNNLKIPQNSLGVRVYLLLLHFRLEKKRKVRGETLRSSDKKPWLGTNL